MKIRKINWTWLFVAFISLQTVTYFFNKDKYFQLSGMFIFLLCALAVGFVWTILNIWSRPIHFYQATVMLLLVLTVISAAVNYYVMESGYLVSYCCLLFMTFLFSSMSFDGSDLKRVNAAYVILAVIISLLIIIFHKRFYADESNRITIQIGTNPLIDPNYLGACLVGPSFIGIRAAMEDAKGRKLKWLLVAIMVIGIFMTGSRGAMLAWGVGVFVIFFAKFFKRFSVKRLGILIALAMIAVALALWLIPSAYIERMFDVNTWMDASNLRRLSLWKNALNMIFQRPLFGYGLGNTAVIIGNAAHNSYLELCVHLGLIGGLAFIVLLGTLILKKGDIYMRALALSTAVWAVFISAEATMFLWLNISLCIASGRVEDESNKDKMLESCNG